MSAPSRGIEEIVSLFTGHGRKDDRGGGLALDNLFEPILRTAADSGPSTIEEFTAAVRAGFMNQKEPRLRRMYNAANPWPLVIGDAVVLLKGRGLLAPAGTSWAPGPAFEYDTSLVVIEKPAQTVTVVSPEQREARLSEHHEMQIRSAAARLKPDCPGLRPLDRRRVARIAASMREEGYNREFPIKVDQYDRLLDGRHRRAAAEEAGVEPVEQIVTVESDRHALQLAWKFNQSEPWSDAEIDGLTELLGGHPDEILKGAGPKTNKAAQALLANPERTQEETAQATAVSQSTVSRSQQKLVESGQAVRPIDARREDIRAFKTANPEWSNRRIAKEFGVSAPTVGAALGVKNYPETHNSLHSEPEPAAAHADEQPAQEKPDTEEPVTKRKDTRSSKRHNWGVRVQWSGDRALRREKVVQRILAEPQFAHEVWDGLTKGLFKVGAKIEVKSGYVVDYDEKDKKL